MTVSSLNKKKNNSPRSKQKDIKVAAITLGCPKNQVDTEELLGLINQRGIKIIDQPEHADWLFINTCAFIQSAEQETIQSILAAAKLKHHDEKKRLIVVGCIVKKYGQKKLKQLIPEIDLAILPNDLRNIETLLQPWLPEQIKPDHNHYGERFLLSGPGTAFLKITEGCSRKCAFCLIPQLRGPLLSKPISAIVTEAEQLLRQGAKELVLVAQDTASYGKDLKPARSLVNLIDQLIKMRSLQWLRLMYINPDSIDEPLVQRIRDEKKICNYLDMPVQHASPSVLKGMKRSGDGETWIALIKKIRKAIPDISLRTTLLTGFPGESENDHNYLKSFIKQARFDRLGVFTYSKEPGTASAQMKNQIHHATKMRRQRELMDIQTIISQEQLTKHIGKKIMCLIEEPSGKDHVIGRTSWDAPEIDGAIILRGQAKPGQLVRATVTGSTVHDLVGEIR